MASSVGGREGPFHCGNTVRRIRESFSSSLLAQVGFVLRGQLPVVLAWKARYFNVFIFCQRVVKVAAVQLGVGGNFVFALGTTG